MCFLTIGLILFVFTTNPVHAQTLEQVEERVAQQDWAGAADALIVYVERQPAERARLVQAAEWWYWAGQPDRALDLYRSLIEATIAEREARLGAARIYADRVDVQRTRYTLEPLLDAHNPDALALMGQVSFWAGRSASSLRWVRRALAQDPAHPLAASLLRDLRLLGRPNIEVGAGRSEDTQPLSGQHLHSAAHLPLHPAQTLSVYGSVNDLTATSTAMNSLSVALGHRGAWLDGRVRSEVRVGRFTERDTSSWTLYTSLALHLHPALHLQGGFQREVYRNTEASLSTFTVSEQVSVRLSGKAGAWAYEGGVSRTTFPDHNVVDAHHFWTLRQFPISGGIVVRAGAAVSWQDAEASTFTPVMVRAPRPGQAPVYEGRYIPYYTPEDWLRVDVLAQAEVPLTNILTVYASAAVAAYSRDEAPFVYVGSPAPVPLVGTYTRTLHPATYRAALHARVSPAATLVGEVERFETAFYTHNSLRLRVLVALPYPLF